MRPIKRLKQRRKKRAFKMLLAPIVKLFKSENIFEARGDRPLQMSFDDQLNALIFLHLEEYSSGRELLQSLEQNDFAKECVAPPKGIKKSSFFHHLPVACNLLPGTAPGTGKYRQSTRTAQSDCK